jgi:hypothetical protein
MVKWEPCEGKLMARCLLFLSDVVPIDAQVAIETIKTECAVRLATGCLICLKARHK